MALALASLAACQRADEGSTAERGAALFQRCTPCHGPSAEGNRQLGAPPIAGLDGWYVAAQLRKFKSGVRGAHPEDQGGAQMRPIARALGRDPAIEAVAQYVAGLPPEPRTPEVQGDLARGKLLWDRCSPCHGAGGDGLRASGAPPINLASDWYLLQQLRHFRQGIRGGTPGDATGAAMRAVAASLPDEQALSDVVAYLTRSL